MSSFQEDYDNASMSIWLVASGVNQTWHHIASTLKRKPHMYPKRFITVQKFSELPHFIEIYTAMKRYNQRYGNSPEATDYFDLIVHPRSKYGIKSKVRYCYGARLTCSPTGEITISKVNRSFPQLVKLLHSSVFIVRKVSFEADKMTPQEALEKARKRMLMRRVLSNDSY